MTTKHDLDLLTLDELHALIQAPSRRAPSGVRNAAFLALLAATGLRASEALALRPKDLELSEGRVIVQHGKGDKHRVVGIVPTFLPYLDRWMDLRKSRGINGHHPVFCQISKGREGGPVSASYMRQMIKRMATRAGIEKRVHLHGLRHAHAVCMRNNEVPMDLIQRQLGHESLATTQAYLSRIAPTELIDAMSKQDWSA